MSIDSINEGRIMEPRTTNTKPLKLEIGKRYILRNGAVTEPVMASGHPTYPFTCGRYHYTSSGGFYRDEAGHLDLISEYTAPLAVDRTVFGSAKVGAEPVPVVDKFAELKEAFRNGVEIEFKYLDGHWLRIHHPTWSDTYEYRVKPKPISESHALLEKCRSVLAELTEHMGKVGV